MKKNEIAGTDAYLTEVNHSYDWEGFNWSTIGRALWALKEAENTTGDPYK